MSTLKWDDIDLGAGNIVTGEIISIDHNEMTASVSEVGENIPIHYHCDGELDDNDTRPFDSAYPDDTDNGGSAAFSVGDEVCVMFRRLNNRDPLIIGFKNESKLCCVFKFSLEGEDAGELTEDVSFTLYGEDQNPVSITTPEYDEDEGCWMFSVDMEADEEASCEGPFWAKYFAPGFKTTQYHGVDESESWFSESDRVIMGDGTLYFDLLKILEGETGYWEDWAEDLLCGYRNWKLHLHTDTSIPSYQAVCPALPISGSAREATGSINISNEAFVINLTSTVLSDELNASQVNVNLIFETENTEEMLPVWKKCIIKLNEAVVNELLSLDSYSEMSIGFFTDDDKRISLFFYPSNFTSRDIGEVGKLLNIHDRLVIDEPIIFDFKNDEEFGGWFTDGSKIKKIYIFFMSSAGDSMNAALDYIDFPKWETWDDGEEPDLCKNHNWLAYNSIVDFNCPSLPFSFNMVTGVVGGEVLGSGSVSIKNGTLSFSANQVAAEYSYTVAGIGYWKFENTEEPDIFPKKLVLKFRYSGSGDIHETYIQYTVSSTPEAGLDRWTQLHLVQPPPEDIAPWSTLITDNDYEEQEIDLTSLTFIGSPDLSSIPFVSIVFSVVFGPGGGSVQYDIDYIDFICH